MRTRFLADFFNSSASSGSFQTLDFLRFPPPQLPSPDLFNFDNIFCFDQASSLNIYPEIERFSVNEALNKFFSDVLPQHINVEINQYLAKGIRSEEKIDVYLDGADKPNFSIVQFETPLLHIFLDSYLLHEDKMQIFFEVADAEVRPDLHDFSLEVQQLINIHNSVFTVEDFSLECQEEHKSHFLEDGNLVQDQIPSKPRTFPLLEVDEASLGMNRYFSEDKDIFESSEPQKWKQKDESTCDAKELLLATEFDIFEHLLNDSTASCLEFDVLCVNFPPDEDIISTIERSMTDSKQESHSGLADAHSSLTLSPLAFEQFQFFDINIPHLSEVFSKTEIVSEVEYCEQMSGDGTLSTFDGLIVTHELTLRDDSFKSLPVPIVFDHEKILSVHIMVAEILLNLKPQPFSTSDGIYLDWHLLEEDICSHNICTSLKMFEDIDTYCVYIDTNLCDRGMLMLEFVLSDVCSNEQNTKEKAEVLNIQMTAPLSGNLLDPVCHDGIASSKLNGICQEMASGEALLDNKINRAPRLVESMLQFNDLDFFLNPLEATYVKRQKPDDKRLKMDYVLPMVSAKGPIETHDNGEKQWQSWDMELHSRGDHPSISLLNESSKNSEGLPHSTPVEEKNSMGSLEATHEVVTSSFPLQEPQLPSATESKKISASVPSPDAIIVVNTQNVDVEMIISRRSTYQRILAMEKEGVQVVERDVNLPIDVIVGAAVCLVFYDSKNIRRKTSSDNISSSLPSCVENIAANVLTSLSFAFSCCVLIFEGEVSFLASIMEASDELYAAAASLGIGLQLFCSYSSESTDEMILNCIAHAAKSTRGLYPKMPESETLAESFLTKFPSVHPLSAHAILSSVGTLTEFLEMSHRQRVCAVQKYLVPDVSITLFSTLCRYGEREDSRSGMTDCCSSVSSGHDSGDCCPKGDGEQRKRYIGSPERRAMPIDYLFQFEQNNDGAPNPPKTLNSHSCWNLEAEEISGGIGKPDATFDEIFFGENQRSGPTMILNPPSMARSCNCQMSKVPQVSGELNLSNVIMTETSFGQSKKLHMPIGNKLSSQRYNNSKGQQEGFKGEVIDIDDDDAMAGEDFSFVHPVRFPPMMGKGSTPGICGTTGRLSSGWCSFPTAAEISSDLHSWISTKDNGQSLQEGTVLNSQGTVLNSHTDLMNNGAPLKHQQMSSAECSMVNSPTNFSGLPFKEKDSHNGMTPLSKAIFSAQPQKGSPWTIDFLNRIKEKSRLRQQSVPCISPDPCYGHSGNSSKVRKRKSPSILDFYKYQRSSTVVQNNEQKRQKVPLQQSNSSKAVKTSPSSSGTWTPINKRAKRRLTFATNGSKGQSKLKWSDKTDQTLNRRL